MIEKNFSTEELMTLWQCSRQTVYLQLRTGKPKAFRVGKLWRVSASALAEFSNGRGGEGESRTALREAA